MDERAQALQFLQDALPTLDSSIISDVLEKSNGDMEIAMEKLLQWEESEIPVKNEVALEDEDMRIARELQAQFDAEIHSSVQPRICSQEEEDERLARELSMQMGNAFSSDADLAFQLQNQWNGSSNANARFSNSGMDIEDFLKGTISQEDLDSLLDQLKHSIIPLFQEEAMNVDLPGTEGEIEIAKIGRVEYGFSEIRLASFDIPSEDLVLVLKGSEIHAISENIEAKIDSFQWFFKQLQFPKLKDKGEATASLSKTSIDLRIRLQINMSGTSLVVNSCDVKIGNLEAKVKKNTKRVLYNIILGIMAKALKPKLEELLEQSITKGINSHSKELLGGM